MALTILFYMFATTLVLSASVVVFARNAIYNVLFLILAFLNASGLFLLAGSEFLAMILAIVYVGAVAVLFLFVVMMLDLRAQQLKGLISTHLGITLGVGVVLLTELLLLSLTWTSAQNAADLIVFPLMRHSFNTKELGNVLYTHYFYVFQIAGLILLVAMIGAIVLTLGFKKTSRVRKQDINQQLMRKSTDTLVMCNVPTKKGVVPGNIPQKDEK